MNIKRLLVKIAIFLLKGTLKLKQGFVFVARFLKKPLSIFGKLLYEFFFQIYKIYFFVKRQILKIVPAYDILSLATNKYLVHGAIIIVAIATVSQNIYAHSGSLGDYGKESILFELTQPKEEETIEGLPIHSDIESELEGGKGSVLFDPGDSLQTESLNTLGFVGAQSAPTLETQTTRTGIEYYIVKKGDTLSGISQQFGISLNTVLWANQLTARSYIRPGDKLTILPVSGVAHTVEKGDTLNEIAGEYKAEKERIIEFNHLVSADDLKVGEVLVVPDGKIIYSAPRTTYVKGYSGNAYESTGALLWPCSSRRITQYFHWRHPGLDIGLPSGSRLLAADSGRVIYSGWGTGYGYQVLIDHGGGVKTRYAHASRLYVRTGANVSRGDTIALSGNTGWSTGPHLHFEVYINGVRRNPLLYIR